MSLDMVRAYNLRCDNCSKLFVKITSLFWSDRDARKAAAIRGWKIDTDGDFCPVCAQRLKG